MRGVLLALVLLLAGGCADGSELVVAGGRVVDPESGLDGRRWIAVDGGRIGFLSDRSLRGEDVIDATGLIVVPGFIDLEATDLDPARLAAYVRSGVTSALATDPGVTDVDRWYRAREGGATVHYGTAVSWALARGGTGPLAEDDTTAASGVPLDGTVMEAVVRRVREGLAAGAVGITVRLDRVPGATLAEIEDVFAVAGFEGAPLFARPRDGSPTAVEEVLDAAGWLGTPLHLLLGDERGATAGPMPRVGPGATLRRVEAARAAGLDATVAARPAPDGRVPATGGAEGGLVLAGDGAEGRFLRAVLAELADGAEAGGSLGADPEGALARVTLLPARRLEGFVPDLRGKGRIRPGADADLVVIDPDAGVVRHVIVEGVVVVRDGELVGGSLPGRALRGSPRP